MGRDLYVSLDGNDSNSGESLGAAWRNPSVVPSRHEAGDRILVAPGVYDGPRITYKSYNCGMPDDLISWNVIDDGEKGRAIIKSNDSHAIVFSGQGELVYVDFNPGFTFTAPADKKNCAYIGLGCLNFRGCAFDEAGDDGIKIIGHPNWDVSNVIFNTCTWSGWKRSPWDITGGDNIVIYGFICDGLNRDILGGGGLQKNNTKNLTIDSGVFRNMQSCYYSLCLGGITLLSGFDLTTKPEIDGATVRNILFENVHSTGPIILLQSARSCSIRDIRIDNCTCSKPWVHVEDKTGQFPSIENSVTAFTILGNSVIPKIVETAGVLEIQEEAADEPIVDEFAIEIKKLHGKIDDLAARVKKIEEDNTITEKIGELEASVSTLQGEQATLNSLIKQKSVIGHTHDEGRTSPSTT